MSCLCRRALMGSVIFCAATTPRRPRDASMVSTGKGDNADALNNSRVMRSMPVERRPICE